MSVDFKNVRGFPGWAHSPEHRAFFEKLLIENKTKYVLEIGSGANPTLDPTFVRDKAVSYITSDADARELEKADAAFQRLVLDVSSEIRDPTLFGRFDCVLSRMVGEHIKNGEQYHKNIYQMLKPGGISVHCFSTLWSAPFIANRLLPEPLSDLLLKLYRPRDRNKHGKFKAYYSWSRGPTRKMLNNFEKLGFNVIEYTGYFGHSYYQSIPLLDRLEQAKANILLRHPLPLFCSYAKIILRKPDQ